TTCAARTRHCCLTLVFPFTSSPHGADTIRRCCYATTPSAPGRRTRARPPSSVLWQRACWARTRDELIGSKLGPKRRCCQDVLRHDIANHLIFLTRKDGRVL